MDPPGQAAQPTLGVAAPRTWGNLMASVMGDAGPLARHLHLSTPGPCICPQASVNSPGCCALPCPESLTVLVFPASPSGSSAYTLGKGIPTLTSDQRAVADKEEHGLSSLISTTVSLPLLPCPTSLQVSISTSCEARKIGHALWSSLVQRL